MDTIPEPVLGSVPCQVRTLCQFLRLRRILLLIRVRYKMRMSQTVRLVGHTPSVHVRGMAWLRPRQLLSTRSQVPSCCQIHPPLGCTSSYEVVHNIAVSSQESDGYTGKKPGPEVLFLQDMWQLRWDGVTNLVLIAS